MKRLYGQPVKVTRYKRDGQWGLKFTVTGTPTDYVQEILCADIPSWIRWHLQDTQSPLHPIVSGAKPFVQGSQPNWLLIEFWTKDFDLINAFTLLLMGRFEFNIEPIESEPV